MLTCIYWCKCDNYCIIPGIDLQGPQCLFEFASKNFPRLQTDVSPGSCPCVMRSLHPTKGDTRNGLSQIHIISKWEKVAKSQQCDRNVLFIFEVLCKFWHVLETSWALNITLTNQDQSSQESVLCTKCSISYIISRWPVNRVYWETSSFSVIYAGKIAFFTFGR